MKYTQIEQYVEDNRLLLHCPTGSGIYGITINDMVVYVGQAKNIYRRCCQHIYNTQNAMLNNEKKYLLLLGAQLGGYSVDCQLIQECKEEELNEVENYYISKIKPMLNIITPEGKQDISNLTLGDVLQHSRYNINFGFIKNNILEQATLTFS